MATPPAHCDPCHLRPEELSVEFEVRGILGRGSAEFRKLQELMEAEAQDPTGRPVAPHAFPSEKAELTLLQRLQSELTANLQQQISMPDWDKSLILSSRVAHLAFRVDRLRRSRPVHPGTEQLFVQLMTLVANFNGHMTRWQGMRDEAQAREMQMYEAAGAQNTGARPKQSISQRQSNESRDGELVPVVAQRGLEEGAVALPDVSVNRAPIVQRSATQQQPEIGVRASQLFPQAMNVHPYPQFPALDAWFRIPPPVLQNVPAQPAAPGPVAGLVQAAEPLLNVAGVRPARDDGQFAGKTMSRWTIRYAGGPKDLAIDEFVFRVEEMAASSGVLLADMVGAFHVLVSERAAEWYWGFRRKQRQATWAQFREALIKKFASRETDEEIRTVMGQRMQRTGERFDDYCRAIEALSFRLREPLADASLVHLLKANADPQLRRVLSMHVARTVDELQDICLKYEDHWISQGHWKGRPTRAVDELSGTVDLQAERPYMPGEQQMIAERHNPTVPMITAPPKASFLASDRYMLTDHYASAPDQYGQVAERYAPMLEQYAPQLYSAGLQGSNTVGHYFQAPDEPRACVSALQAGRVLDIVCWNCEERGHSWQDCCVATRNIFCYGCGARNVYRPQCQRCCSVNDRRSRFTGPSRSGNAFNTGPSQAKYQPLIRAQAQPGTFPPTPSSPTQAQALPQMQLQTAQPPAPQ